jgi:hypothetical protein
MYETTASPTEKCLAYIVADHLNCVTLDSWPGQRRIASLLGVKSLKTVQRAAGGLIGASVLSVRRDQKGRHRYAPIFLDGDQDKNNARPGQQCLTIADKNDHQSFLVIHPTQSSSTATGQRTELEALRHQQRGEIEVKVAEAFGREGWNILGRLSELDDAIITRLCLAYVEGSLGSRELAAAGLAYQHL